MSKTKKAAGGVAYSYIRWSRPEQAEGDSLRRQLDLTRDWCKRNGVRLDESLTFRDEGVSGFHGSHRQNPDRHALAAFLEKVKLGTVRPGSYLVIENLDRLSREHVRAAVKLFLDLLDSGINIVTTLPERVFRHDSQEMTDIIIAVVELSRGHSESAAKSERCRAGWAALKRKAATEKVPITRIVPAWLSVTDGKFALIPEKAEAVRRIYRLARDGYGIEAIVKALNREVVKPISEGKRRGRQWTASYVASILTSRAVVGEYQPHKGKRQAGNPKARQPDGPPIAGYFPTVITEDEWHATRAAIASRRKAGGRRATIVNIFKGLLRDAATGTTMHVLGHRRGGKDKPRGGPAVIYPYAYTIGAAPFTSFPLAVLESAILSELRELDPRTILPKRDAGADRVLTLTGKLADVEGRIAALKAALTDGDPSRMKTALAALGDLEGRRDRLADELAQARQEAASPLGVAWGDAHSLIDVLAKAPDPDDARTRLRAALRRIVADALVVIVRRDGWAFCVAQLWFSGGDKQRLYLVWHRPARKGFMKKPRPAAWGVLSDAWTPTAGDDFDLRRSDDTAAIRQFLMRADITRLTSPD